MQRTSRTGVCVRECGGKVPKSRDGIGIASEELVKRLSQSSTPSVAVDTPRAGTLCASRAERHRLFGRRAARPVTIHDARRSRGRRVGACSRILRRDDWCTALDRVRGRWRAAESQIDHGFEIALLNRRRQLASDCNQTIVNHIKRARIERAALGGSRRRILVLSFGIFYFWRRRYRLAAK